jgi:hypothetical protein
MPAISYEDAHVSAAAAARYRRMSALYSAGDLEAPYEPLKSRGSESDDDWDPCYTPDATSATAPSRLKRMTDERFAASWDQRQGEIVYAIVPEREIEPTVCKAAYVGYRFALLHLGLEETPALRFFRKSRPDDGDAAVFRGGFMGGHSHRLSHTIGIRVEADTTPSQACEVAAHEVFHLAVPKSRNDETDAYTYGVWAASVLTTPGGKIADTVHYWPAAPLNYQTLKNKAEAGDVLVARNGRVYRNSAQETALGPVWAEYWQPCPVLREAYS